MLLYVHFKLCLEATAPKCSCKYDGHCLRLEVTLPFGSILAGFGKAKFRELTADAGLQDKEILFEVTGSTYGILGSKVALFSEHLADAKGTSKNVRPCYHKAVEGPEQWTFEKDMLNTKTCFNLYYTIIPHLSKFNCFLVF